MLMRGMNHELEVCRLEQNNNTNQLVSSMDNILNTDKTFRNGNINYSDRCNKCQRLVKDYRSLQYWRQKKNGKKCNNRDAQRRQWRKQCGTHQKHAQNNHCKACNENEHQKSK